jgi:5-methylcytosine-specific restriction enzyme B
MDNDAAQVEAAQLSFVLPRSSGESMSFVQKIFYGPPGTGKTWRAAREAVRAVSPEEYKSALAAKDPDAALAQLHRNFVKDGRIVWVTFHPGYSYEDFIEGYRPTVKIAGQLTYEVVDGPFKLLCDRARGEADLYIGDRLLDGNGRSAGEVIDKDGGGWLIYSRAGRLNQISPESYRYVSRIILKRLMDTGLPPTIFSIPGVNLFNLKDYGLKPTDPEVEEPKPAEKETEWMRVGNNIRGFIGARVHMSSTELGNSAHYGWVWQRMLELKEKTQPRASVLVIDEINRADLARVFGELLTLLERDKREGKSEEKQVWLPYSKTLFTVPANLSVIGTMNTVDRSLTAMDYAMRRRFEFEFVDAESDLCPQDYGGTDLRKVLTTLNNRLSVLLGSDYRIGHAALMSKKLEEIVDRNQWRGQKDAAQRAIAHVWRSYIIPTVLEYFHDDLPRARAAAGFAHINGKDYDLFQTVVPDPALLKSLPDEYDLQEARSYIQAEWWNPLGARWDAESFRNFLQALADLAD